MAIGNSATTIAIAGVGGTLVLIISLLMGLDKVASGPAGDRAKLAMALQKELGFDRVIAEPPAAPNVLAMTYHVHVPSNAPRASAAQQDEARKLYAAGREDVRSFRSAEAEAKFKDLRERLRHTSAYIEYEMWDLACVINRRYTGTDKKKLDRILVKRRAIIGSGPAQRTEEKTFTLDLPKLPSPTPSTLPRR